MGVSQKDAIRYDLNQGDYEQAIALLKEHLDDDPADDEAKILLASAYSGSVGINTIDCFEVLRPKLFDRPLSEKGAFIASTDQPGGAALAAPAGELPVPAAPNPDSTAESREQRAILAIERELLKFSGQASDALETAFKLPHVPLANRDRIVLSLAILTDIPESSDQYLTAQLYQGILSFVQFMNYFRDAIPPGRDSQVGTEDWYQAVYCQLDLGILLPNLSQAIEYLSTAFNSLANAGRKSDSPIYANLAIGKSQLVLANRLYLQNQDLFEFADWSDRASKASACAP